MLERGRQLNDQKKLENIRKMLKKYGLGSKKDKGNKNFEEKVHFSEYVVKINRREKDQNRFLVITESAIYNLHPNNLTKCKRRILIENVASMSISTLSDEFVLHVWNEYDYRFKSNMKEIIKQTIADRYFERTNKPLNVKYRVLNCLRDTVLTKKKSRQQSRQEKLERRKMLMEIGMDDSDKEDEIENKEDQSAENMLEPSKKIGITDFVLLKVVGRGSFGKVLQVRKKDTGKIYAMKILKKSGVIYQNQIEHTNAERKILQMIEHPFLMKLRFAFQTKAKLYIVIDFFRGGELFFHLKKRERFNEKEARFIVAETMLALGHLHKNGVFYRDLKPENILLDNEGHICLTDFGLSKIFEDGFDAENETRTFCGTPEYLAPEVIQKKSYTSAVDWWSLGVLIYELTVGCPPFKILSNNTDEMYFNILMGNIKFPGFISSECKDLIKKLLESNPSKRLGSGPKNSIEIMEHSFFKTMNWEDLLMKRIPPPYVPKKTTRETDTGNFDKEFTNEPVADSYVPNLSFNNDYFDNFSYQG